MPFEMAEAVVPVLRSSGAVISLLQQVALAAFALSTGAVALLLSRRRPSGLRCIETPVRGELFTLQQLQAHAVHLAKTHELSPDPRRARPLLPRLEKSHTVLERAYRILTTAVRHNQPISPAAEWLLDNFWLIEQQTQGVRDHLPRRYYLELPKLSSGKRAGYPRIYDLAVELIAHTHAQLDVERLTSFVQAYQPAAHLSIGELWALPLILRFGLLEDLRRSAEAALAAHDAREEADALVDSLLESKDGSAAELVRVLVERMQDEGEEQEE